MNSEERGKLIAWSYGVGLAVMAVLMVLFLKNFNTLLFAIPMLIVQQAYLVPNINKNYHKLMGAEPTILRFVPHVNEYQIFSPLMEKVCAVTGYLAFTAFVLGMLPLTGVTVLSGLVSTLFGDQLGLNFTFYCFIFAVMFYTIHNVVRGLAFVEVKRVVDREYRTYFGKIPFVLMEKLQYLMHFFPFLRTMSLAMLNERLRKMIVFNDLDLAEEELYVEKRV